MTEFKKLDPKNQTTQNSLGTEKPNTTKVDESKTVKKWTFEFFELIVDNELIKHPYSDDKEYLPDFMVWDKEWNCQRGSTDKLSAVSDILFLMKAGQMVSINLKCHEMMLLTYYKKCTCIVAYPCRIEYKEQNDAWDIYPDRERAIVIPLPLR